MDQETRTLQSSKVLRHETDGAVGVDHLNHQKPPHQGIPSRIKRPGLSAAGPEQDVTQPNRPNGATSTVVPGLPLEGDPFGPHWAIEEDAGSYNPPDAPNVDVSPKVTQEDWDEVMASLPLHQRRGLRKQDYHRIEPCWLIGKPMFPHQLHDRLRADLNMIDEKQGGFEPLPMPALAHDENQWTLPAMTHIFDEVNQTFEPIDQRPKRAKKKSLLTEDMMDGNITGFLTQQVQQQKRTAGMLAAKDNIFAREA